MDDVIPQVDTAGGRAFPGRAPSEGARACGGEGQYYYNARWYDATLGRFISEDPARDQANWYAYVENNPLTRTDPSGLADVFGARAQLPGDKVPLVGSVNTGIKPLDTVLSGPLGVWNVFATAVNMPFNAAAATEMGYNAATKAVLGQEGFSGEGLTRDAELVGLFLMQNPAAAEAAGAALRFITGTGPVLGSAEAAASKEAIDLTAKEPFKGRTLKDIDKFFREQGFEIKGKDPMAGRGSYIDPATGTKYYLDPGGTYRVPGKGLIKEQPHVDVQLPGQVKDRKTL